MYKSIIKYQTSDLQLHDSEDKAINYSLDRIREIIGIRLRHNLLKTYLNPEGSFSAKDIDKVVMVLVPDDPEETRYWIDRCNDIINYDEYRED